MAAWFDGEGCVHSRTRQVSITNSFRPTLEVYARHFGGAVRPRRTGSINKQLYEWRVCGSNARRFLAAVLPFLWEKRQQAVLALMVSHTSAQSPIREEISRRLARLKRTST